MSRFLMVLSAAGAALACGPAAAEVYTWKAVVTTDTSTPGAEITFGDNYSQIVSSLASPVVATFTMGGVTRVFGLGNPDPYGSYYGGQAQIEADVDVYGLSGRRILRRQGP